ncbi:MAG: hypothetical protein GY696_36145 [Gammaproteobacteria bacterium]|nr:hypothetical protein [Gammaproteobacteria bacterium]
MNKTMVYLIDDEPELVDLLSDVVEMSGFSAQGFVQAGQFFDEVGGLFAEGSILVLAFSDVLNSACNKLIL